MPTPAPRTLFLRPFTTPVFNRLTRHFMPPPVRLFLGFMRVSDFLRMRPKT